MINPFNMVNALFSSKKDGSKLFQRTDKCVKAIDDLYQQELEQSKQHLARMIPKLKEIHVLCDAWTKLNIHPTKIMQVRSHHLIHKFFLQMVARASFRRAPLVH